MVMLAQLRATLATLLVVASICGGGTVTINRPDAGGAASTAAAPDAGGPHSLISDGTDDPDAMPDSTLIEALAEVCRPCSVQIVKRTVVSTGTTEGHAARVEKVLFTAQMVNVYKNCTFIHYSYDAEWKLFQRVITSADDYTGNGTCPENPGCFRCRSQNFFETVTAAGYSGIVPGTPRPKAAPAPVAKHPVKFGEPQVTGEYDPGVVSGVAQRHKAHVANCYQGSMLTERGNVTIKFTVSATGAVTQSSVAQSDTRNPDFETCVAGRIRTWEFPKPKGTGAVVVVLPIEAGPRR